MKTSLEIPDDVVRGLKVLAAQEGRYRRGLPALNRGPAGAFGTS